MKENVSGCFFLNTVYMVGHIYTLVCRTEKLSNQHANT